MPDEGLLSMPLINTAVSVHSSQFVSGELIAFWTSVLLKYILASAGKYPRDPGKPRISQVKDKSLLPDKYPSID